MVHRSWDAMRQPGDMLAVIAGPTAVGKTQVAIALSRRVSAEIVCADSRTLYRGMDVGTAKPTPADRAAVPHHLLDVAAPDQVVTLAEYQRLAMSAIAEIRAREHLPLLVGGTGLYIHAVVDRLGIPPVPPDRDLRARLQEEESAGGPGTLHRRLRAVDPAAAARIHPRNVRRIIRALEVYVRTGAAMTALHGRDWPERRAPARSPFGAPGRADAPAGPGPAPDPRDERAPLLIALTMDRPRLYARIDRRIEQQISSGLIDEVRALLRFPRTLPALAALGYREILAHLEGTLTLDEAIARVRRNTRRYAKRQWTWFRADPRYRWVDVGDDPPDAVAARIHAMLTVPAPHGGSE